MRWGEGRKMLITEAQRRRERGEEKGIVIGKWALVKEKTGDTSHEAEGARCDLEGMEHLAAV
jgi:hypothetical protein